MSAWFIVVVLQVLCEISNSYKVPERLPYVVSLKQRSYYDDQKYSHFCTGSILSEEWILTAGHCFTSKIGTPIDYLVVDVGSAFLTNGTHYRISDYFIHPNQSESIQIYRNDLALVRLNDSLRFSSRVKPVQLGTIEDQDEVEVLAGGWGRDVQRGFVPNKVRFLQLKTMKFKMCQEIHKERNNLIDTDTHICGYGGIGRTLCFGNSGGPLLDRKTMKQVAVFSALEDCSGRFPVLFMRVEPFIDWINDVTDLGLTLD